MRCITKDSKGRPVKGIGTVNRHVLEARNKYNPPPLTIYPEQKTQNLTEIQAKQNIQTQTITGTDKSASETLAINEVFIAFVCYTNAYVDFDLISSFYLNFL